MGKLMPDIYNPDGSLNEAVLNERSRRIKERQMIPAVEVLRRERKKRILFTIGNIAFRVALVCIGIALVMRIK